MLSTNLLSIRFFYFLVVKWISLETRNFYVLNFIYDKRIISYSEVVIGCFSNLYIFFIRLLISLNGNFF